MANGEFDVFICYKSQDLEYAKQVYNYLANDHKVFFSDSSLEDMSDTDYQKHIDAALESSTYLLIVTSKIEYLSTKWVETEWRLFISDVRSGRKPGNIITLLYNDDISVMDLPLGLRQYEVIYWDGKNSLNKLRRFLKISNDKKDCIRLKSCVTSLGGIMMQIPLINMIQKDEIAGEYFLCITPVSNREYLHYVTDGGDPPGSDWENKDMVVWNGNTCPETVLDHPVINVSHQNAVNFCEWLTIRDIRAGIIEDFEHYSLPEFVEWKYAVKNFTMPDDIVVGRQWSNIVPQPTAPVYAGTKSPYGLSCLYGNVFEWCIDFAYIEGRSAYLATSGGWATDKKWIDEGNIAVWRQNGWPMKDCGFRLCLKTKRESRYAKPQLK